MLQGKTMGKLLRIVSGILSHWFKRFEVMIGNTCYVYCSNWKCQSFKFIVDISCFPTIKFVSKMLKSWLNEMNEFWSAGVGEQMYM